MSGKELDREIGKEIARYGGDIIRTPLFQRGFSQTHHKVSTVADHTLNVTIASARLSRFLEKRNVSVKRGDVIKGALLHDLGIIGREEKYRNNYECGQCHAADSVKAARELFPDLDENVADIIEHHMFPITKTPPKSREGAIVLLADKYCAVAEWFCRALKRDYHADAKREIFDDIK